MFSTSWEWVSGEFLELGDLEPRFLRRFLCVYKSVRVSSAKRKGRVLVWVWVWCSSVRCGEIGKELEFLLLSRNKLRPTYTLLCAYGGIWHVKFSFPSSLYVYRYFGLRKRRKRRGTPNFLSFFGVTVIFDEQPILQKARAFFLSFFFVRLVCGPTLERKSAEVVFFLSFLSVADFLSNRDKLNARHPKYIFGKGGAPEEWGHRRFRLKVGRNVDFPYFLFLPFSLLRRSYFANTSFFVDPWVVRRWNLEARRTFRSVVNVIPKLAIMLNSFQRGIQLENARTAYQGCQVFARAVDFIVRLNSRKCSPGGPWTSLLFVRVLVFQFMYEESVTYSQWSFLIIESEGYTILLNDVRSIDVILIHGLIKIENCNDQFLLHPRLFLMKKCAFKMCIVLCFRFSIMIVRSQLNMLMAVTTRKQSPASFLRDSVDYRMKFLDW